MTEPFIFKTISRFSDTDLYGIVHHSNYFRWMEEARMQLMEEIMQLSLEELKIKQIQFPVTRIEGKYIKPVCARQPITIRMILYYNDTSKLVFNYEIQNDGGQTVFRGKTEHILTIGNEMQLSMPDFFDKILKTELEKNKDRYIVLC